MGLDTLEQYMLTRFLGGFLYGVYSGIFALYLRHYVARTRTNNGTNNPTIFYSLCVLYILSGIVMILDLILVVYGVFVPQNDTNLLLQFRLIIFQVTIFGFCDFIAQSILIHRCWIVWGQNTRVVIIPIILAFSFLVTWLVAASGNFITAGNINSATWGTNMTTASLVMSMSVNALVTGLIVFRIFKVFREVKANTTLDEKSLGVAGGRTIRRVMFVMIESGMALFSIQLARVMSTALRTSVSTNGLLDVYNYTVNFHEMLNGIIPTIILVRVSMGLSFHDKTSLIEAAGSLRFADPIRERSTQEGE